MTKKVWRLPSFLLSALFLSLFLVGGKCADSGKVGSGHYGKDFLWGVAWSAHQTEGLAGGGENSDWYDFEHSSLDGKPTIVGGDTADLATDHWNRYEEDLELVRKLGTNTFRISLAWEKIEPRPGEFNQDVLEHYRKVLLKARELGLKPMVALHHFTHPKWFVAQGSWLSKKSPELFARYARAVAESLGPDCDEWITFNEPMVIVGQGYLQAKTPPLKKSKLDALQAMIHLIRAHRQATAVLHASSPKARVGLVNSTQYFVPRFESHPADVIAARLADRFWNWLFVEAAVTEYLRFKNELPQDFDFDSVDLPLVDPELQRIPGSPVVDWIGINYYRRQRVTTKFASEPEIPPPGAIVGDNGWESYPPGLLILLERAHAQFPNFPLMVSENGMADALDNRRPEAIRQTLQVLDQAIRGDRKRAPLPVIGYFHWSLTDNFEWLEGYAKRFGLVEIRYDQDLKRIPRPSFSVYQAEIEKRREL